MGKMKPLRIFLCDLTHDTVILVSDTIPINIGFVGAYCKKQYGDDVELSLFKYPQKVIEAIKNNPPDVIALSNYSWNSYLSERVAQIAKAYNRNVLTVQGGTNFPHQAPLQREFLLTRPSTDVHIELEGEIAFMELIGRALEERGGGRPVLQEPAIPGCVYIAPSTRASGNPVLVKGERPPRIKLLDEIPSPYLNGLLDTFFDGRLTPFLETNRGCPFTCTFCHTGNDYFNKVNNFTLERVKEEISFIAPRMKEHGIVNLHIADTNFGMYPRDREICEVLVKSQKDFGWPLQIMATTGKNNKERVIEITQMMGNTFSVNMSVQSMDPTVLTNIKRSNIKLDHYVAINKSLSTAGRSTKGEVILGLPGETKESFVKGLREIIEAGVSSVCSYSLMLLHGTSFKEPEYRKQFGIQGKYRIVPLNFGNYDGTRIFDVEETGISNKDMSFDDYLWVRGLSLIVEVIHNSKPFHELFLYISGYGVSLFDFILKVYGKIDQAPNAVKDVMNGFLAETRGELWETEEELLSHYRKDENYQKLAAGEVGGNVIFKYKAMSLAFSTAPWVEYMASICKEIVNEKTTKEEARSLAHAHLDLLSQFIVHKLAGVLNSDGDVAPRSMESQYDIMTWRIQPLGTPLSNYHLEKPITYEFTFTSEQMLARADQFKRYGAHINGISKIVTRVSNVESLFRKINVLGEARKEDKNQDVDMFIRYSLSN